MSKGKWFVCLSLIVLANSSHAQQAQHTDHAEGFTFEGAELYQRFLNTGPGMSMPTLADAQIPAAPCLTTGMTGETGLPNLPMAFTLKVPAQLASKLAYYKGTGATGVLGPRGWTCRQYFGSSGSRLKIAPTGGAFEEDAKYENSIKYSGELIERSLSIGDTSGRSEVARVAARIFPVVNDFVDQLREQGIIDKSVDPLPGDTYFYLSPTVAIFRTERDDEGIAGRATGAPMLGLAYLMKEPGQAPDLTLLKARLGTANSDLVPIILANEILEGDNSSFSNPGSAEPPEGPRPFSLWAHNGSTVYLVAQGASREFHYEQPRPGITNEGPRKGTLLFKGVAREGNYEGTAYIFKRGCRPAPYQVSGPILDDSRRVLMRGNAPKLNERCQVTGHAADTLEFTLVSAASEKQ
jgi:hypothetical protein